MNASSGFDVSPLADDTIAVSAGDGSGLRLLEVNNQNVSVLRASQGHGDGLLFVVIDDGSTNANAAAAAAELVQSATGERLCSGSGAEVGAEGRKNGGGIGASGGGDGGRREGSPSGSCCSGERLQQQAPVGGMANVAAGRIAPPRLVIGGESAFVAGEHVTAGPSSSHNPPTLRSVSDWGSPKATSHGSGLSPEDTTDYSYQDDDVGCPTHSTTVCTTAAAASLPGMLSSATVTTASLSAPEAADAGLAGLEHSRRRDRHHKKEPQHEHTPESPVDADEARRQRNRTAQRTYRERRKRRLLTAEEQVNCLSDRVHLLEVQNAELRKENEMMKEYIDRFGISWPNTRGTKPGGRKGPQ